MQVFDGFESMANAIGVVGDSTLGVLMARILSFDTFPIIFFISNFNFVFEVVGGVGFMFYGIIFLFDFLYSLVGPGGVVSLWEIDVVLG